MTFTTCHNNPIAPRTFSADVEMPEMPEVFGGLKIGGNQFHLAKVEAVFDNLPDRDALRLFRAMSMRWSVYSDHADIDVAIDRLAGELAQEEGWEGNDLAARYLEDGK